MQKEGVPNAVLRIRPPKTFPSYKKGDYGAACATHPENCTNIYSISERKFSCELDFKFSDNIDEKQMRQWVQKYAEITKLNELKRSIQLTRKAVLNRYDLLKKEIDNAYKNGKACLQNEEDRVPSEDKLYDEMKKSGIKKDDYECILSIKNAIDYDKIVKDVDAVYAQKSMAMSTIVSKLGTSDLEAKNRIDLVKNAILIKMEYMVLLIVSK